MRLHNKAFQLTTKSGAPIVALLLESTELKRYAYKDHLTNLA